MEFKIMRRLYSISRVIFIVIISMSVVFAQNGSKEVKLSQSDKKLMNTFFSNFSEVSMEPFTRESLTDTNMIRFGVFHNYRNNEIFFVKTGKDNLLKIKANYIDESVKKFFGKSITKHQSIGDIEYKNGWYYITESSGEAFIFSQVVKLSDNGNKMFTAIVNIYSAGSGWTGNVHGTDAEWEKGSEDDIPEIIEVMKATLQKVVEKGKSRYILIEYTRME